MTEPNERAVMGGNNPPDPIDEIGAQHESTRIAAENWLDGVPVSNQDQLDAVSALRVEARVWRIALEKGQKDAVDPLLKATNAERDRWKPSIADAKRIEAGLVAAADGYKRKLIAEREAKKQAEWEAARKAKAEAERAQRDADTANIEAQREAEAMRQAAIDAERTAQEAAKSAKAASKGTRKVHCYEIKDGRAAINWIAKEDGAAMSAFLEEYVRRNHRDKAIAGVRTWTERGAY